MTVLRRAVLRLAVAIAAATVAGQTLAALPLRPGSVRFLVIGDSGTGDRYQFDIANRIVAARRRFPFTFAIMLGDNIYGSERPQDMDRKFTRPYKALLDAKVEFNAALGNHDDPNQRFFKPFNLGGERYRTFKKGNARFFVLDSNYMDPEQLKWLENQLKQPGAQWKIAYFHHPLYTTSRRGPEVELRRVLEPLLVKYKVDVVFTGHEHIYERIAPQKNIYHFTCGGAAKLRYGDTRKGPLILASFDRDRTFTLVEISGRNFYFETISRVGAIVDSGVLRKRW